MPAIQVSNVRKCYGTQTVLNGVTLSVDEGAFYALMGPNGSGKTTLSSIIAAVTGFDDGTVEIYGRKPEQARRLIGYVPQDNFSVPQLTGRENLLYFAGLAGYSGRSARALVDEILGKIGLAGDAGKRAGHYSGGMRKRLEIGTALFPDIRLLILDEPTTGLDPSARREFLGLLKPSTDAQTTVFLVTHLGTDADVASKVGLMDRGRIVAEGTPDALKTTYAAEDVITIDTPLASNAAAGILREYSVEQQVSETRNGYRIFSDGGSHVIPEIARRLEEIGCPATRTEVSRPTLEDVFFRLTEHSMQEVTTK